jgi:hypothetical protein
LPKNLENFINSAAASTVFKENLDKNIKLKKKDNIDSQSGGAQVVTEVETQIIEKDNIQICS